MRALATLPRHTPVLSPLGRGFFSVPLQDIEIADNLSAKIYTGEKKGAA
jgi:hypothetical protein